MAKLADEVQACMGFSEACNLNVVAESKQFKLNQTERMKIKSASAKLATFKKKLEKVKDLDVDEEMTAVCHLIDGVEAASYISKRILTETFDCTKMNASKMLLAGHPFDVKFGYPYLERAFRLKARARRQCSFGRVESM